MATQTYVNSVTLSDAAEWNKWDTAAYCVLSGVAGTNTITATGPANYTYAAASHPVFFVPAATNTGATTVNITPSGGAALGTRNIFWNGVACIGGELRTGVPAILLDDGTRFHVLATGTNLSAGIIDAAGDLIVGTAADTVARLAEANWLRRGICDFRLTLTTAVPVTTSDVTGATTIYCAPYKGNQIALYDGSANWNIWTSAEFSLALGTLTSGKPYDVFCYDNAGTPTLEFLAWTNTTTRATALTTQDGVLVKTGATTRRYLGTFVTTSTTETADAKLTRYLWNYYNRVDRDLSFQMATDTWTYATDTLRAANGSAASSVSYVCGFAEDAIWAEVKCNLGVGTGLAATLGIGVDSTTVNSAQTFSEFTAGVALVVEQNACYCGQPSGVGLHTITWLERVRAGTVTFVGDNATPNNVQSGLIVGIKA